MDDDHIYTWEGLRNIIWRNESTSVDTVEQARKVLTGWAEYHKMSTLFVDDTYVFPEGTYKERVEELKTQGEVVSLYALSHYCILYKSLGRILYLQERYCTEDSNVFTKEKDMNYYKQFFFGRVSVQDYKAYLKKCGSNVETTLDYFEYYLEL
jgi:hypothetical protein